MFRNKYINFFTVLIATMIVIILFSYFTRTKKDPNLIAKVGIREIKVDHFIEEMKRRSAGYKKNLDKKNILDEMISREIILSKVFETDLHKDPEIIRLYENLLIGKYKQRKLKPLVDNTEITKEDIQQYYDKNIAEFSKPEKIRIAILFMKIHSKMSDEKINAKKNRMQEAIEIAKKSPNTKDFGVLSINYSEDQTTRYKGGDIGWVYKDRKYRWEEPVLEAGFALKNIGNISSIITGKKGIYIVKLIDRRKSEIMTLNSVKARIRHKMLLQKRKNIESTFYNDLKNSTKIEIFNDVFESIPDITQKNNDKKEPPLLP